MRKSLGDKRREIPVDRAQDILKILADFKEGDTRIVTKNGNKEEIIVSRIFPTTHFGYRKITVERPLRLNFAANPERIARLEEERGFKALAESKKKGAAGAKGRADGEVEQERIRKLLQSLPDALFKDRAEFEKVLDSAAKNAGVGLAAPVRKALLSALSERDETAAICRDKDGKPEPDPELRDYESVPLAEDVESFFAREVRPHVADAWIDTSRRDPKDEQVGVVGYEINLNRFLLRSQGRAGPALCGSCAHRQALQRHFQRGATRVSWTAERLCSALCVPGPGAHLYRCRPGKALRVRSPPAPPPAGRPD
jgi:type I restriction enzyme M protein